jgi:hypothetical protein
VAIWRIVGSVLSDGNQLVDEVRKVSEPFERNVHVNERAALIVGR